MKEGGAFLGRLFSFPATFMISDAGQKESEGLPENV
jgi:hypothetical protein